MLHGIEGAACTAGKMPRPMSRRTVMAQTPRMLAASLRVSISLGLSSVGSSAGRLW